MNVILYRNSILREPKTWVFCLDLDIFYIFSHPVLNNISIEKSIYCYYDQHKLFILKSILEIIKCPETYTQKVECFTSNLMRIEHFKICVL